MCLCQQDIVPAASGSRRVLDGVGSVASAVSGVSTTPSKMVASWTADQLAPSYWVPNSKIKVRHTLFLVSLSLPVSLKLVVTFSYMYV